MIGAIIGDIAGSIYEFNNIKTTDFPLLSEDCFFTDDTVMTVAVAEALLKGGRNEAKTEKEMVKSMRKFGKVFPDAGYGYRFSQWLTSSDPKPYGSFGNGSAMRVSPVAWYFHSLEKVEKYAEISARVTHDHEEGIKGAKATAVAIFMARRGYDKDYIKRYLELKYKYDLSKTLDEIRPDYQFDETCQGTVPAAFRAFYEAESFEDTLRKAISLGGDSDTIAAIACSIAEAYYPIPEEFKAAAMAKLDKKLLAVIEKWNSDLSVTPSKFEQRDIMLYADYLLTNPRTERKTITHPDTSQNYVVPEYNEIMYNFIHDAVSCPLFRDDYAQILANHNIRSHQDMVCEVCDASEVLLEAMFTVIISGEKVRPGNVAWAAEDGILGDIMFYLRKRQEEDEEM
ncbi:MAG: ADP-ribosylglycohydrolase family protein [Oscillospiraceae bacterium]|nr:ADP-ribosylglycohydrolase family protein [Oscillospiraceae bacterium]